MNIWWVIIILLGAGAFLFRVVRYIPSNQRMAICRNGKYAGLIQPGLHFKFLDLKTDWLRLTIGQQGTLQTSNSAIFQGVKMPVANDRELLAGTRIEISSFADAQIHVIRAHEQNFVCVKHLDTRS